jgi:hypothetical protein
MSEGEGPIRRSLLLLALCVSACSSGASADPTNSRSTTPIIDGAAAVAYPESALLDLYVGGSLSQACSGALVAPQVVLTAGHCVVGVDAWVVSLPYAHAQRAHASWGEVYDYQELGEEVNPQAHDVGLVFLDVPLYLQQWPVIATAPLSDGSEVVNIGRILDGQYSTTALFVGQPLPVRDGQSDGFPFDYAADDVIQPGDSGGPAEVPGSTPHQIAAVNSGVGGATEVLARVDMLAWWIVQEEWTHGGPPEGKAQTLGGQTGVGTGGGGSGASSGKGNGSGDGALRATSELHAGARGCSAAPSAGEGADALLISAATLLLARARRRRQLGDTRPTASSAISGNSSV